MFSFQRPATLPTAEKAIAHRQTEVEITNQHYVNGNPIRAPFPDYLQKVLLGMGCFWGAERLFYELSGVYTTAVGYAGGITENATYQDVCSGMTGHAEVVLVVYDPVIMSLQKILTIFWESHNPTQGMRQGNDQGTQYRSAIYTYSECQFAFAVQSRQAYQKKLTTNALSSITTEIVPVNRFYYAEDEHQQYLEKNPGGYCRLRGTGVRFG